MRFRRNYWPKVFEPMPLSRRQEFSEPIQVRGHVPRTSIVPIPESRKMTTKHAHDLITKYGLTDEAALSAILAFWGYETAVDLLCDAIDRGQAVADFEEFLEENHRPSSDVIGCIICDSPTMNSESSACEPTAQELSDEEFLSEVSLEGDSLMALLTSHEHRTVAEYVPDQWDMEMLAWAYLDEFSSLAMHEFTTGWSGKSRFRIERFEVIAKYLGEEKRREILKSFDECQTRRRGDDWQVFKQAFEPGFWSLPVIKEAVVRVAASVLRHRGRTAQLR